MKQKYWVVKDEYEWMLHLVDRAGWEVLVDRSGEDGHFTLFESAQAAHVALSSSLAYYSDVPMKVRLWRVEEFVP